MVGYHHHCMTSLPRAVRVRCLALGHLDRQAGDQTSNLLVTSQPALSLMPPAKYEMIMAGYSDVE